MSYATLKVQAEKQLELAAAYAGDGAIETAIIKTCRALRLLEQAKTEKAVLMKKLTNGKGP